MRKSIWIYGLLSLLLVVTASSAFAVYSPPFTPQRTLFWDFSTSNWQQPTTIAGPTWHGEGWTCDNITIDDPQQKLQWVESSLQYPGHTGLIGLDNSTGQSQAMATVTFHINNYNNQNPVKHIYFEAEYIGWLAGSTLAQVDAPQTYTTEYVDGDYPTWGTWQSWDIKPNPDWEEVTWSLYGPAGGGVYLDRFYISTLCVPEPSSLMALGSGLMAFGGLLMKRRRA